METKSFKVTTGSTHKTPFLKQNHSYRFPKNCDARNERSSLDLDISVYPFFYPFLDAQKGINPGFGANPGPRAVLVVILSLELQFWITFLSEFFMVRFGRTLGPS